MTLKWKPLNSNLPPVRPARITGNLTSKGSLKPIWFYDVYVYHLSSFHYIYSVNKYLGHSLIITYFHLIIVILVHYAPHSTKLKGGILVSPCPAVRLSIRGHNSVRSVPSTILAGSISYLHTLSSNFRWCAHLICFNQIENFKFWQIL